MPQAAQKPLSISLLALLRSFIFVCFQISFTVLYGLGCLLTFPLLTKRARYAAIVKWCQIMIAAARFLCGLRYVLKGWEHLPQNASTPIIFLAKHQSAWETLALPALLPQHLCFVFKRELLFIPFFGWVLGMLDMIHINRKQGREAWQSVSSQGKILLQQGRAVIFFPEGTRTAPGTVHRYKTGGARLAIETATPIIPIAHNAGLFWPKKSWIKTPGTITVSIGPAISPAGLTPEQLIEKVKNWIEAEVNTINASGDVVPANTHV